MLMRFSVSNFMSFDYKRDDEGKIVTTDFSMYAGRTEHFKERVTAFKERKVLKFSAIYGANAAGKSNLITAIECGKRIIVDGIEELDIANLYCKTVSENKDNPTFFEYEFTIKDRCFAYGFEVNLNNSHILTEWLVELDNNKENTIYERDAINDAYYFDENLFSDRENVEQFHFFMKDVNRLKSSLLLFELERRNLKEKDFCLFGNIYKWFENKLIIVYPETKLGTGYFRFGKNNEDLIKLLEYFDTGITGYKMQDMNESAFREYFRDQAIADKFLRKDAKEKSFSGGTVLKYGDTLFELFFGKKGVERIVKLLFRHGTSELLYDYGEESDGTQRLIEMFDIILNQDPEKTYVIDELDRSLHPQMTIKFVETFLQFNKNTNTQMIITTHESNLMDLKILRRDEIWFAEREANNSTSLYSLEKYKIRYDKVVSRDYLAGRYGAVPLFKDFNYVWKEES